MKLLKRVKPLLFIFFLSLSSMFNFNSHAIEVSNFKYADCSNVKYGHNDKKLKHIEYIVIHSTSNTNVSAINHIKWLNSNERANATHYYVDDKEVIKALSLGSQAQGVLNNKNNILNNNSIHIEICEFSDPIKQELAIRNAIEYIKNNLLPNLNENVKIVRHKDATNKNCPRIISDDKWKDFLIQIYD